MAGDSDSNSRARAPADGPERSAADDGVIRPVSYRPAEAAAERRLTLSPLQGALLFAVLLVTVALWFLFTAKSVRIQTEPANAEVSVGTSLRLELGDIWLLRGGEHQVTAEAPGYQVLESHISVGAARNQTHLLTLTKLPGQVTFHSDPPGATVSFDDQALGVTPTEPLPIPAGPVTVTFVRDRYQPLTVDADIEGMERPQTVGGTLLPAWADVQIDSVPQGAEIFVDDEPTGQTTPATVEILAGEHEVRVRADGHKSHRQRILVAAREQRTLPTVELVRADSLLTVRSTPSGAGVTLDGQFQGRNAPGTGRAERCPLPGTGVPGRLRGRRDPGRAGARQ